MSVSYDEVLRKKETKEQYREVKDLEKRVNELEKERKTDEMAQLKKTK